MSSHATGIPGIQPTHYNGRALRRLIRLTLHAFTTQVLTEVYATQSKNFLKWHFGKTAYAKGALYGPMLDQMVTEVFDLASADNCAWVNMSKGDLLVLARLTHEHCCHLRDLASAVDNLSEPLKGTAKDYTPCNMLGSQLVKCEKMLAKKYAEFRNKHDSKRNAHKAKIGGKFV